LVAIIFLGNILTYKGFYFVLLHSV
jgi:hypothetical protein